MLHKPRIDRALRVEGRPMSLPDLRRPGKSWRCDETKKSCKKEVGNDRDLRGAPAHQGGGVEGRGRPPAGVPARPLEHEEEELSG
jgi:hypothetical protein